MIECNRNTYPRRMTLEDLTNLPFCEYIKDYVLYTYTSPYGALSETDCQAYLTSHLGEKELEQSILDYLRNGSVISKAIEKTLKTEESSFKNLWWCIIIQVMKEKLNNRGHSINEWGDTYIETAIKDIYTLYYHHIVSLSEMKDIINLIQMEEKSSIKNRTETNDPSTILLELFKGLYNAGK